MRRYSGVVLLLCDEQHPMNFLRKTSFLFLSLSPPVMDVEARTVVTAAAAAAVVVPGPRERLRIRSEVVLGRRLLSLLPLPLPLLLCIFEEYIGGEVEGEPELTVWGLGGVEPLDGPPRLEKWE